MLKKESPSKRHRSDLRYPWRRLLLCSTAVLAVLVSTRALAGSAPKHTVKTFSLIDSKTNQVLIPDILARPDVVVDHLDQKCLNIRAHTDPNTTGSVGFGLGGNKKFSTDDSADYHMMGDDSSLGCLKAGSHFVKATAYSKSNRGGKIGGSLSLVLQIFQGKTSPTVSVR